MAPPLHDLVPLVEDGDRLVGDAQLSAFFGRLGAGFGAERIANEKRRPEFPLPRKGNGVRRAPSAQQAFCQAHAEKTVADPLAEQAPGGVGGIGVKTAEIRADGGKEDDISLVDGVARRADHVTLGGGNFSVAQALRTSKPSWLRARASQITVRSAGFFSAIQTSAVMVSP